MGKTEGKRPAAPARRVSISQVCGDTAGGWLWSCEQHGNHGNATTQTEADHTASAHEAFHSTGVDGLCEIAVWERTVHHVAPGA